MFSPAAIWLAVADTAAVNYDFIWNVFSQVWSNIKFTLTEQKPLSEYLTLLNVALINCIQGMVRSISVCKLVNVRCSGLWSSSNKAIWLIKYSTFGKSIFVLYCSWITTVIGRDVLTTAHLMLHLICQNGYFFWKWKAVSQLT